MSYTLLGILGFLIAVFLLIRTPRIQTWLANKAANYLSEQLHTDVKIGKLKITWFLNISITDVLINDLHHQTLFSARNLVADIGKISRSEHKLDIDKLIFNDANIQIRYYKGEEDLNIQFLIDYFSPASKAKPSKPSKPSPGWKVTCSALDISNTHFLYQNQSHAFTSRGMDYNNIDVSNINLSANKLRVLGDTIFGNILNLNARERCGLVLKKLQGKAKVSPVELNVENLIVQTNKSDLLVDLHFKYPNWNAYNYFIDSVRIESEIFPSDLNLNDISFFAPEMQGMDDQIMLSGLVQGPVSNLKVKNFRSNFGETTHFNGNFSLNGLPTLENTFINLNINELYSSVQDLQSFKLPGQNNRLKIPSQLLELGNVNIAGIFTGFYNDFVSYASFKSDMGNFSTDISLKNNKKTKNIDYQGNFKAQNFKLGTLLADKKYFGKLNANLEVSGSGYKFDNFDIQLNGKIDSLNFKGLNYNNLEIKGTLLKKKFNGMLTINDKNICLNFIGLADFSSELPVFNFTSTIENARLTQLRLTKRDSLSELSTTLRCDFTGSTIDNIQGSLKIENTSYSENHSTYYLKNFSLDIQNDQTNTKNLTILSDYVDAKVTGKFTFLNFYHSFNKLLNHYLPSVVFRSDTITGQGSEQNFACTLNLKNTDALCNLFVPGLFIAPNTHFSGNYQSGDEMASLTGSSDLIVYKGIKLKNWTLEGMSLNKEFILHTGCKYLVLKEKTENDSVSIGLDSLYLNTQMYGDSLKYNLVWNDFGKRVHNKGDIHGHFDFSGSPKITMKVTDAKMLVNDSLWTISRGNQTTFDTSAISIHNLAFEGNGQKIEADGIISHDPLDKLNILINNYDINHFDFLLPKNGLDFNGIISGNISIFGLYQTPNFISNLKISGFEFNNEKMGDLIASTTWDYDRKALAVDANIIYSGTSGTNQPFSCKGYYYPDNKKENFDFAINLQNMKLQTLSPFVKNIFSDIHGYASGNLSLKGTTAQPELLGKLQLMRTEFKVDYTNVSYSFAHEVFFEKNLIRFDNLVVTDANGNKGLCNGKIRHTYFNDFQFDINIMANKLSGLGTDYTQNNIFYGNALVSGMVSITGPPDNLQMNLDVSTEKETDFYLPLNISADLSSNDYIKFVNTSNMVVNKESPYKVDLSDFKLDFNLNVTPEATIHLSLPMQMGKLKFNGSGLIRMGVNTRGEFNMFGEYIINQGTFLFTLQNMINKQFNISKGSTIKWNGSAEDADIDLSAVYTIKASLSGLPIDSSLISQRVPVNCVISLKNKLTNPEIAFKIRLPNVDEQISQQVFSVIDTNNQAEMNKQMISLLVLNSFSYSSKNTNLTNSVGASSFELLSNQLSGWLSQINKDFDIGVNYRPGDKISNEQLEVALSTQLFNNRVQIDGNFGVKGNTSSTQQATSNSGNNIVGDVNIDWKITKDGQFHVKAYNKSNTLDIINDNSPYTQGVGVFYRKDFDHFGDLFRRKKKQSRIPGTKKQTINKPVIN
ncbi:MAG TPA: translocation/assembly module TamB domain-containing protein [Bacteroidales bacterium]|nr:translocation/assembly module TamB domain-containing protein [Bacteroidales bacterium]